MKRVLCAALTVLFLCVCLAGCGKDNVDEQTSQISVSSNDSFSSTPPITESFEEVDLSKYPTILKKSEEFRARLTLGFSQKDKVFDVETVRSSSNQKIVSVQMKDDINTNITISYSLSDFSIQAIILSYDSDADLQDVTQSMMRTLYLEDLGFKETGINTIIEKLGETDSQTVLVNGYKISIIYSPSPNLLITKE